MTQADIPENTQANRDQLAKELVQWYDIDVLQDMVTAMLDEEWKNDTKQFLTDWAENAQQS